MGEKLVVESDDDVGDGGEDVLALERVVTMLAEALVVEKRKGRYGLRVVDVEAFLKSLACEAGKADDLSCKKLTCPVKMRLLDITSS